MSEYRVYCTNCLAPQVEISNRKIYGNNKVGCLLTELVDEARAENLCCHNGECMMDEDYVIQKAEKNWGKIK